MTWSLAKLEASRTRRPASSLPLHLKNSPPSEQWCEIVGFGGLPHWLRQGTVGKAVRGLARPRTDCLEAPSCSRTLQLLYEGVRRLRTKNGSIQIQQKTEDVEKSSEAVPLLNGTLQRTHSVQHDQEGRETTITLSLLASLDSRALIKIDIIVLRHPRRKGDGVIHPPPSPIRDLISRYESSLTYLIND